jgi:hypothetical protein
MTRSTTRPARSTTLVVLGIAALFLGALWSAPWASEALDAQTPREAFETKPSEPESPAATTTLAHEAYPYPYPYPYPSPAMSDASGEAVTTTTYPIPSMGIGAAASYVIEPWPWAGSESRARARARFCGSSPERRVRRLHLSLPASPRHYDSCFSSAQVH